MWVSGLAGSGSADLAGPPPPPRLAWPGHPPWALCRRRVPYISAAGACASLGGAAAAPLACLHKRAPTGWATRPAALLRRLCPRAPSPASCQWEGKPLPGLWRWGQRNLPAAHEQPASQPSFQQPRRQAQEPHAARPRWTVSPPGAWAKGSGQAPRGLAVQSSGPKQPSLSPLGSPAPGGGNPWESGDRCWGGASAGGCHALACPLQSNPLFQGS